MLIEMIFVRQLTYAGAEWEESLGLGHLRPPQFHKTSRQYTVSELSFRSYTTVIQGQILKNK